MKHVAVIVCNNGLGHLRRVLSVIEKINFLSAKKYRFSVFFNLRKTKYFQNFIDELLKCGMIDLYDVDGRDDDYEKEFIGKYHNHLMNADYVWSDNYTFPLEMRPDTLLTGSFLWMDLDNNKEIIDRCVGLLKHTRPVMIGIDYFATENVRQYTDFIGVGIYEYYAFELFKNRNNILISFGKSPAAGDIYIRNRDFVREYIRENKAGVKYYIEPEYFNDVRELPFVFKADYTEDMFRKIGIAVIRPGIGTICGVLSKSGHIISVHEKNNYEMENNAMALGKTGVGETSVSLKDALEKAEIFLNCDEAKNRHYENVGKLRFGGLRETASKMIEVFEK